MLRLYSKGCEYAIRALVNIAAQGPQGYVAIQDICRRAHLPEPSTRKTLQLLAQKGFLRSVPGPNGGYRLSKQPDQINILEIIQIIDGAGTLEGCVLGLPVCRDKAPCALHETWKNARQVLLPALRRLTLENIRKQQ